MALIYRSALLLILLACGGCVTDQFGASNAAAPGQPSITISRSDDFTYRAAAASVEINGKPVATLAAGRIYTGTCPLDPPCLKSLPGRRRSAWRAIACHPAAPATASTSSGKSYSFVISPRWNRRQTTSRTTPRWRRLVVRQRGWRRRVPDRCRAIAAPGAASSS